MGKIKYIIAAIVAFACLGGVAEAGLIDLGIRYLPGPLGSSSLEGSFVTSNEGLTSSLNYLNKFEYGGGWEGDGSVGSGHFNTSPDSGETATATITWNLTGTGSQLNYVLVKSGRDSGFFLYRLYAVTADSVLSGSGVVTVNGSKGISHISLFGGNGSNNNHVPEGGATCAMLGMAMTGLWFARRFIAT